MALKEVAGTLEAEGMEAEIFPIGAKAVQGCIACRRGGASVALDRLNKYFSINNTGGQLPVLEYRIRLSARRGGPGCRIRLSARRGGPGCRGHADHAHSRPQHGLGTERP